ncbi:hypothetical protein [Streptomyces marincola]|uniref:Uncharacterized protein n=1 Tax=Streptomyces marincola TaxID=2878388 RepID=A0A1W7D154_9ACTN|nr:hypothetical protein [Streptomyces marincola]ARQ70639.1 hypothetical protein CAG99_18955 [Streptomyces marincola]
MKGVAGLLNALHRGETALAAHLLAVADRHRAEHEVHHVATDLARWSRRHGELIADAAPRYGGAIGPGGGQEAAGRGAEDSDDVPPLLLDLRALHLAASGNAVYWEMLGQAARATRDERLLDLADTCLPHAMRQVGWARIMLTTQSPQLIVAG